MLSVVLLNKSITRSSFLLTSRCVRFSSKNLSTSHAMNSSEDSSTTGVPENNNEFYDIVICGGGMVGSAMAYALGSDDIFKNLKVALIESSPKSKQYVSPAIHSNRTCALSETTQDFFKSLGNWDFIEKNRYGTVKNMHVWDGGSDAHITFNNKDDSNLAVIVENNLIQASLTRDLEKFSNLTVFHSSQLKDFQVENSLVDIVLKDESKLTTSLLIGSDGPNSFIRQNAKFQLMKWDYDQVAIVATLKLSQSTINDTAWQRFLSTGPIALLPLNDEYSSLVWSIKKSMAKELLQLSDQELAERVNHAFINEDFKDEIASNIEDKVNQFFDFIRDTKALPVSEFLENEVKQLPPKVESCVENTRGSYPLSFMHANNYAKNRIALIGDAVHRVHPLAGQGVNLGFGDVICLTETLRESILNGGEIGSTMYLQDYETKRQREAFPKVVGIDMLNKLYTDYDYPFKTPLVALRSIGLTMSNRISPLKNFYKSQAMK